jgi:calcineurin-like phosphoesterase family protein
MQKLNIKLELGQNLFLTSDLHFGHRNVLKFCNRPWEDEKQMAKGLIDNWNSVVTNNDIVFVLGDTFWFNDSRTIKKILSQLNGKDIYIIPGNHCDFEAYHRVDDPRIHLCQDIVCLWLTSADFDRRHWHKKTMEIWMQHCPMSTWPHRENGAFHFFGHIHSQPGKTEGVDQDLALHWNQLDVGCDFWDWKPVCFERLLEMFNRVRPKNIL